MLIFGYTLFAFSLFYLFFLWQFPYEGVKKAIIQSFAETLPLNLSIGRIGPSFPLQLHLEKINIRSNTLFFQFPDVAVQSNLINFFGGATNIYVKDLPTAQRLQGEFVAEENQNRMKIQLNNLEIKAFLPNEFSVPVKLSGEATLQWVGENFEKLNGQAWALLQRGEIQGIPNPRLPFPLALLETVRAEIQIQEGNLRVKRLVASGKDLKEIVLKDFQIPLSGLEKGAFPDLSLFFQVPPK
jgi:type II secretion system protein N